MLPRPEIGDQVPPAEVLAGVIYVYTSYNESVNNMTRGGFRAVQSSDYYLDNICTQDQDPWKYGTHYGYFEAFYFTTRTRCLVRSTRAVARLFRTMLAARHGGRCLIGADRMTTGSNLILEACV